MAGSGGRWAEARAEAGRIGEIRVIGSLGTDSTPSGELVRLATTEDRAWAADAVP